MKGDVRVEIACLLPERLIQRAMDEGVALKHVSRVDERRLIIETDGPGARKLLKLCRRFSIPARIADRRGASALMTYIRHRSTLLTGLLVCVALCALFLGRIWFIHIEFPQGMGDASDRETIARTLEAMGVHVGALNHIDAGAVADALGAKLETYSYFGVHPQGVRLLVEAVRETDAPEIYDVSAARDLVASRDGIVVSANVRSGELCVSPGDTVRRGQLLIRGEEIVGSDETAPVAALGEVLVRAWFSGEARLPMKEERTRRTGRISVSSELDVLGMQLPIQASEAFVSQAVTVQRLPVGGLFVPVEIVRRICHETEVSIIPADRETVANRVAALALADAAARLCLEGPAEYRLLRSWINFDKPDASGLHARAVYEIITDAATTREVLLQGG